ncbi:MAG: TatD family hydrolase, partial [Actinobacteria bacterium]|nr:TatD family hydrolase [Actinomycetota bacterium]
MWIDSHCHLDRLEDPAEQVLERARAAGVEGVITIGTDLASSARAIEFAARHSRVWATVGVHPHDAANFDSSTAGEVERLAASDRVVAIGECGLDYHYENSPRDAQRKAFAEQIGLAHQHGLALVIHTRDAWDETFEILQAEGMPERAVFHCFT